jgi:hypothetical protein
MVGNLEVGLIGPQFKPNYRWRILWKDKYPLWTPLKSGPVPLRKSDPMFKSKGHFSMCAKSPIHSSTGWITSHKPTNEMVRRFQPLLGRGCE